MKFLSSLSSPLSYFSFFMQHPKNHDSNTRKPWYERGRGMGNVWKGISKWRENGGVWKTMTWKCGAGEEIEFEYKVGRSSISSSSASSCNSNYKKQQQLRKCRSLKVATSFTRVCLCAPMSSYNELLRAEINNPPRRSNSFPRAASRPSTSSTCSSFSHSHSHSQSQQERTILVPTRLSTEGGGGGRRVFRGKSLTDDVLMRRFVIEEEAMMHINRRRNQMEVIRKRTLRRRTNLGPSPLSRMVLAHPHPHHQQN